MGSPEIVLIVQDVFSLQNAKIEVKKEKLIQEALVKPLLCSKQVVRLWLHSREQRSYIH